MKNKRSKNILQKLFITVVYLSIGAVCGIIIGDYAFNFAGEKSVTEMLLDIMLLFVGFYVGMLVQIVIHEAGHLVFGVVSGYRFFSFRILSITIIKTDGKIHIKRLKIPGTAGQCLMVPPDFKDGKIPVALYNFGGAIMNLLSVAVFAGLHFLFSGAPFAATMMSVFAAVGFLLAITNGIPLRMGMINNDGVNALELMRDPEAMHSFWVQLKVAEQTAKGVRLKDMPDEWFVVPADGSMKNAMTTVKGVLVCNRLVDAKELDRARTAIRHMLEIDSGMIELHRRMLICDLVFIEIVNDAYKNDIDRLLDKKQKSFIKKMKTNPSVVRAQYFYALMCEKNGIKAEKIKKRFDLICNIYPYSSELEIEKEFMSDEFVTALFKERLEKNNI